jgi:hypothetical protein
MFKFKVPRPLMGAMEAAAVCIRRRSNVLPLNMALVSLFNHDIISVNLLLRLNILLALCYLACEAYRHTSQGYILHGHAPHWRVSHVRVPHGRVPHGHASHGHASQGVQSQEPVPMILLTQFSGAKSSAKSVTDSWGAINSKGGCDD